MYISCIGVPRGLRIQGWCKEREFFIDNLLVRIHFIIVMIKWTGLAPWEFEWGWCTSIRSPSRMLVMPANASSALPLLFVVGSCAEGKRENLY